MRAIFLFANEGYGLPFIEQAARWNSCNRENLTIILSGKTKAPAGRWRMIRRLLRRGIGGLRRQWQWGVPVRTIQDVNATDFIKQVPDGAWGIICGFNQIFRQELIARFQVLVNFHPSLLPLYRGPVPSRWCLRNCETRSGYSLHRVTPAIDAGEILHQGVVAIAPDDTDALLDQKIATAGAPILAAYLDHLKSGHPWRKGLVEARSIYRCPVDYASFSEPEQRADAGGTS